MPVNNRIYPNPNKDIHCRYRQRGREGQQKCWFHCIAVIYTTILGSDLPLSTKNIQTVITGVRGWEVSGGRRLFNESRKANFSQMHTAREEINRRDAFLCRGCFLSFYLSIYLSMVLLSCRSIIYRYVFPLFYHCSVYLSFCHSIYLESVTFSKQSGW